MQLIVKRRNRRDDMLVLIIIIEVGKMRVEAFSCGLCLDKYTEFRNVPLIKHCQSLDGTLDSPRNFVQNSVLFVFLFVGCRVSVVS